MRAVVTGATSMIGVALIKALVEDGHEVLAIVREGSDRLKRLPKSPLIKIAYGNIPEYESVKADTVNYDVFYSTLDDLNNDETIHGILLLRPIPEHLDNEKARLYIKPEKDVDGCTNGSLSGVFTNTKYGFAPCTAQAAIEILDYYKIDVASKNVGKKDYKTVLQEIIQRNPEESVNYVLTDEKGPDHDKTFTVEVRLNSNVIGTGSGKSKKSGRKN